MSNLCNNFLKVETLHSRGKLMILEVLKKNFIKKFIKKKKPHKSQGVPETVLMHKCPPFPRI